MLKTYSPSALSLFRFHLSPFPQKRLILRLPKGELFQICWKKTTAKYKVREQKWQLHLLTSYVCNRDRNY